VHGVGQVVNQVLVGALAGQHSLQDKAHAYSSENCHTLCVCCGHSLL
jgi:hypothetical protein